MLVSIFGVNQTVPKMIFCEKLSWSDLRLCPIQSRNMQCSILDIGLSAFTKWTQTMFYITDTIVCLYKDETCNVLYYNQHCLLILNGNNQCCKTKWKHELFYILITQDSLHNQMIVHDSHNYLFVQLVLIFQNNG